MNMLPAMWYTEHTERAENTETYLGSILNSKINHL